MGEISSGFKLDGCPCHVSRYGQMKYHTHNTHHTHSVECTNVHCNALCMAPQKAGLANVIEKLSGNNLPNSCICTFEPTMVDFIAVAVLSCDLALMKFFPRARLGLPSNKL